MSGGYTEIIWSPLAEQQYVKIKDYLLLKFSKKEVKKLNELLAQFYSIILKFPNLYPKTRYRKDVYRAVLSHELSVFYRTKGNIIQVLAIYDNRQNFLA